MNGYTLTLSGAALVALPCGALWWPDAGVLTVSDLHFGKSRRAARRGGALLPPYEVQDTLMRLGEVLEATGAGTVVCLGDSFDDLAAAGDLSQDERATLAGLMAGRRWIWVEGNHDPGAGPGGESVREATFGPLTFRHIAQDGAQDGAQGEAQGEAEGEISGHYHPKARLALGRGAMARPCFLADARRIILPAFGTYTGGLDCRSPALGALMGRGAIAVLTGQRARAIPLAVA